MTSIVTAMDRLHLAKLISLVAILIWFVWFLLLLWSLSYSSSPVIKPEVSNCWPCRLKHISDDIYIQKSSVQCEQTELLILVHSSLDHHQHRTAIRYYTSLLPFKWKAVFVLGKSTNETVNQQIQIESSQFGDIVQSNFLDTYRNLTLKHLTALNWTIKYCAQVKSILKVDDDIFVNYYLLKRFLAQLTKISLGKKSYLICYLHRDMKVIRNNASKWFVKQDEFAPEKYPPFCSGWAYLTTVETVSILLCKITQVTKMKLSPFWIDDVYMTGILRDDKCVPILAINHLFNVDPIILRKWLLRRGLTKWHHLFSNTDNKANILSKALRLNYYTGLL